ncbi:MAG TPA: chemotaxis protein CheW [Geobacteraceae bacterium]|nr:chemotaxis protein CheW [Geobacteraceae bacterium]
MLFSTGGLRYAVNVDYLDEISELLPEYPIPQSPRFLRGVVNIHGKLAVVFDLSLYVGTGPVKKGCNLLLLKMPESSLSIVVERMERMISGDEILSISQGPSATTFILSDGNAELLDPQQLIDSMEKSFVT